MLIYCRVVTGVIIISSSEASALHSNFTVSLEASGVGIQVTTTEQTMSIIITLPKHLQVGFIVTATI